MAGDNSGAINGADNTVESPLTTDADGARDTMAAADSIPGKSPAFQFYANDFYSGTIDLPAVDVGVYIRFLCYQWEKGFVPGDPAVQARIGGVSRPSMPKIWQRIGRHFVACELGYINRKLETVRQEQIAFRRRQSDKGKASAASRKATGAQPEDNRTATGTQPDGQPEGNSSVFGLLSSHKRSAAGNGEDPRIAAVASELLEIYPEVYAACRDGAVYRTVAKTFARDWPAYYGAAELHPDITRLRRLLEIFLTRPLGDRSSPGTPSQFLNMLPECDEVLRKSGWKASA